MPVPVPTAALGLATLLVAVAGPLAAQGTRTYALIHADRDSLSAAQIELGAQEAAAAAGATLTVYDAGNDPLAQAATVGSVVAEGVDGVILRAIDATGIVPSIGEAETAGVPVVTVEITLSDAPVVAQVGVDELLAGATLGQFVAGHVTAGGELVTLGVIGTESSPFHDARLEGFTSAVDGIPLIQSGGFADGHTIADLSAHAAAELLAGNPEITALLATGDAALLGAIGAAQTANHPQPLAIYGWGLSLPVIEAVEAGLVQAVVHVDGEEVGRAAFEALDAAVQGGSPDAVVYVPPKIVTLQNVHEFRPLFQ